MNNFLSIIIPTYNSEKDILNCLKSIFKESKAVKFEVIAVDNASLDKTTVVIKKYFPKVKLIINKKNLGFARACNQGLQKAQGDFILILNPDTVVLNHAIDKTMYYLIKQTNADIIGCQLLNEDKTIQPSGGYLPNLARIFLMMTFFDDLPFISNWFLSYQQTNKEFYKKEHTVDWVTGAFILVKKEVFDQVGSFDESFFMYAEEIEWFYRIKKRGLRVVYYPEAQVIHFKGKSSPNGFEEAVLGEYKGLIKLYQKHYPKQLTRLKLLLKAGALIRISYFGILKKDNQLKKTYEKAYQLV